MLETPKAPCTYRASCDIMKTRENQGDSAMGNQQERFDLELSWLAGIIEGEGWVSLILYTSRQKKGNHTLAFTPCIGMCNCDFLIMDKVKHLFEKLGIKYRYQIRKDQIGKDGIARKKKAEISAISRDNIRILSNAILPFMIGEKKERIKKVIEFLDLRESKPRSGPNSIYGKAEMDIYLSMYGYKGKSRSKILNDYTPGPFGFEKRQDIV
jgi:hypothetical protein